MRVCFARIVQLLGSFFRSIQIEVLYGEIIHSARVSSTYQTVDMNALNDLGPAFKLAVGYSVAEYSAECALLDVVCSSM